MLAVRQETPTVDEEGRHGRIRAVHVVRNACEVPPGVSVRGWSQLYNVGSAQYNPEVLREWVWCAHAHANWSHSEFFESIADWHTVQLGADGPCD